MTTEDAPKEETRAVTVQRERLITEAPAAMFDSAAFEHLQRVATVIFRSGFVPRSLTHEGPADTAEALPESMVVARCVLLADQAQRAGADVIGYIQATSVINGRLMHEGKLVNAIVQRRMGIRLKYRFGLWDTDHIVFPALVTDKEDPRFGEPVDPNFFHGAAERLAVRVFNPSAPDEFVEGSAGQWKTTRSGSPWTKQADWPRQLRYRAVREWARAYDPGTVLGMIADGDEEIELSFRDVTPKTSGVMARLQASENGEDGFNSAHVENIAKPRRGRPPKATDAPPAPEATQVAETPAEPTGAALDAGLGALEMGTERPTGTAGVPTADAGRGTSGSAGPASEAYAAAGQPEAPPPTSDGAVEPDEINLGYPEENEVYMLNGDEWAWDAERGADRRDTYKNGEPFFDAGRDKGYRIYEDHAPVGQPAIASNEEPEINTAPEETDDDELPPDFATYINAVETVGSFADVKTALQAYMKTPFWQERAEDLRNRDRANTWFTLAEERKVPWLPKPTEDVSAFRMWLETERSLNVVNATFADLTAHDAYKNASEPVRAAILGALGQRVEVLKG